VTSPATPAVSVCIPAYNGAAHIEQAVASVLGQTMEDLEVIVTDDASTDATVDILRRIADPRLRTEVNQQNLGPAGNWNRALTFARGRYVKIMGQDDLLHPPCLEEQARILDAHPEVALVSCRRDIIDHRGAVVFHARGLPRMHGRLARREVVRHIVRTGSNVLGEPVTGLFRASVAAAVGPFRADAAYVIDLDYWCRLLEHGDLYALDRPLCAFRLSQDSWSVTLARRQGAQLRALLRGLRAQEPGAAGPFAVAAGSVRTELIARGRRLLYAALRHR
jgi:glycosyltransferase involved in cell wall biosynthesis